MANKTILVRYLPSIADLKINVYPMAGGAVINPSPLDLVETATPGLYSVVMSTAVASTLTTYTVNVLRGSVMIGQFLADLVETVGTYNTFDGPTPLQISTLVAAQSNGGTSISVPSALVAAFVNGNPNGLTAIRGDTFQKTFVDCGDLAGWSKITFTIKANETDLDAASKAQVELNASGGTNGLIVLNGAAQSGGNLAYAEIIVEDEDNGDIKVVIDPFVTSGWSILASFFYDLQVIFSDGRVLTPSISRLTVVRDYTLKIS